MGYMDETTVAYLAGLIDGEGYIGIKRSAAYRCQGRQTRGYAARIQCRMVEPAALELLDRLFGGHLYRERVSINRVRRPLICWSVSNAQAEAAIRALAPYLRIKRNVAATVLRLRHLQRHSAKHRTKVTGERRFPNKYGVVRIVPNMSFSDDYVARCETLWMRCRTLNHRPGWAAEAA